MRVTRMNPERTLKGTEDVSAADAEAAAAFGEQAFEDAKKARAAAEEAHTKAWRPWHEKMEKLKRDMETALAPFEARVAAAKAEEDEAHRGMWRARQAASALRWRGVVPAVEEMPEWWKDAGRWFVEGETLIEVSLYELVGFEPRARVPGLALRGVKNVKNQRRGKPYDGNKAYVAFRADGSVAGALFVEAAGHAGEQARVAGAQAWGKDVWSDKELDGQWDNAIKKPVEAWVAALAAGAPKGGA